MMCSDWPLQAAVVVHSCIDATPFGTNETFTYIPRVEYEYIFKKRKYTGNRIEFRITYYSKEDAEDVLRKIKTKTVLMVHVNPDAPEQSVIWPALTAGAFIKVFLGQAMAAIGVYLSIWKT